MKGHNRLARCYDGMAFCVNNLPLMIMALSGPTYHKSAKAFLINHYTDSKQASSGQVFQQAESG